MVAYKVRKVSDQKSLTSTLSVFRDCQRIFIREFNDPHISYKLSPSGRFLAVDVGIGKDDSDEGLHLFDIAENKLLFSTDINIGFILDLFFLGDEEELYVKNQFSSYKVNRDGSISEDERRRVNFDAVFAANTYSIDYMERYLNDNDHSEKSIREIVAILDRIIEGQYNQFHGISWAAIALRKRGELLEKLGEDDEAILNYIDALYLNPKIGVKGKLNKLAKKHGIKVNSFEPSERALRIESSCHLSREISAEKSKQDWEEFYKKQREELETVTVIQEQDKNKGGFVKFLLFFIGIIQSGIGLLLGVTKGTVLTSFKLFRFVIKAILYIAMLWLIFYVAIQFLSG